MALLRTLAHLFLVLALLAGSVAPASVPVDDGADTALTMSPPCHDLADEPSAEPSGPPAAAPADCCGDGACACDCLQQSTAGFLAAPPLPRLPLRGVDAAPSAGMLPPASAAPDIRPPIA